MSYLNTVDYIIIALLLLGGIQGAIKGFLEEFSQKFGLIVGFIVALMFTVALSPVFETRLGLPVWLSACLSYVSLFLAGYLIMKLIGTVLQAIFQSANLDFVDDFFGFVLGLFEMIIVIGFLVVLLSHQKLIDLNSYFDTSLLCNKLIVPFFNALSGLVQKFLK